MIQLSKYNRDNVSFSRISPDRGENEFFNRSDFGRLEVDRFNENDGPKPHQHYEYSEYSPTGLAFENKNHVLKSAGSGYFSGGFLCCCKKRAHACAMCLGLLALLVILLTFALVIHQNIYWPSKDQLVNYIVFGKKTQNNETLAFPLVNAHSHNDYLQIVPLKTALAGGFCSVEADVYLINDNSDLATGHLRPSNNRLVDQYLTPLAALTKTNRVRPGPINQIALKTGVCQQTTLLIDFKSDPIISWIVLEKQLEAVSKDVGYEVFQRYDSDGKPLPEPKSISRLSPIKVVMSGILKSSMNHLAGEMKNLKIHRTLIDGRWEGGKIAGNETVLRFLGLVSSEWKDTYRGKTLESMAAVAQSRSVRMRFWAAPDDPETWNMLIEQGCIISSNKIASLKAFLLDGLQ